MPDGARRDPGIVCRDDSARIEKDGVHSDFPLTAALVGFLHELIDILFFSPRPCHLLGIFHWPDALGFSQFL
jgi:hypothetical protein